jgi:4'-phosphopantetheinyl transferase
VPSATGVLLAGPTTDFRALSEDALTPAERSRADALRRGEDRADFVAAHLLVRECAAAVLDTTAAGLTLVQHCAECGEQGHGRPSIAEAPDLYVTLSHTRGYVAAAADTAELAVDVERTITDEPDRLDGLAATVLTPAERHLVRTALHPERTFAQLWVRKEALIKLDQADLDTLTTVDVSAALADAATYRDFAVVGWSGPDVTGVLLARNRPRLATIGAFSG